MSAQFSSLRGSIATTAAHTLDSNQSTNLTIWGCFSRCSICSSSYTIFSFPLTFFLRMILTATLPVGPSASRTTPYVPAPRVRPNRYRDLRKSVC